MKKGNKRQLRNILIRQGILLFLAILLVYIWPKESGNEMTYNQVMEALEDNNIEKVKVRGTDGKITMVMKDGTENYTYMVDNAEFVELVSKKVEKGAKIEIEIMESSPEINIFSILTMVCYVTLTVILYKQTRGGNFHIGKNPAKETFQDVAGIEEVEEQVKDIIEYLKDPKKYSAIGAKIPKGILLSGSPGNGKTLLAKAISGEAGVSFFQVTGSSFEERLVGVGASRVRKLFEQAKKSAPAIIFIDEIDSIARSRYTKGTNNNEQTLNQLLAEMDGFESSDNVIVIAATNHIEVLDEAILRPGRFDRCVYIPNPDVRARQLILELHARDKLISSDVSFQAIAQKTVGFSGADLSNVLNEAAIYAVNVGQISINNEAIEEAIARVIVGLKKKNYVMTEEEKHSTAIHEAGHAIVSAVIRPEVKNFCISIVPRGKAGGYNFFDEYAKNYRSKTDMLKQIQVLYAGRAAEEVLLNEISSGASNDWEKASKIALEMVTKYGMSDSFLVKIRNEYEYNKKIDSRAMEEAESICRKLYEKTREVVKTYSYHIGLLAEVLEKQEYLSEEDVESFMSEHFNL